MFCFIMRKVTNLKHRQWAVVVVADLDKRLEVSLVVRLKAAALNLPQHPPIHNEDQPFTSRTISFSTQPKNNR